MAKGKSSKIKGRKGLKRSPRSPRQQPPTPSELPLSEGIQDLRKRANQDGLTQGFLIDQRPIKASQILLAFGEEVLLDATDLEGYRKKLSFLVLAWNIATLETETVDEENISDILQNHLHQLGGLIFGTMRIDLLSLIKRKQALYSGPQYQYIYHDWVLKEYPSGIDLSVTTVDM
jgi:hypothetical protein